MIANKHIPVRPRAREELLVLMAHLSLRDIDAREEMEVFITLWRRGAAWRSLAREVEGRDFPLEPRNGIEYY
jgi:hypothetical protein